jgi:hypothetical protein
MRLSKFSSAFLFTAALFAGAAMAADAPKLESINAASGEYKDCPVEHGKTHDNCEHKDGKPCLHYKDKAHHGKAHDKCEHKH